MEKQNFKMTEREHTRTYICLRDVNNIIELDNGWYVDTENWAY